MNFFEVYPSLTRVQTPLLKGRSLRLISISAIVYDDEAFYFQISSREMWGHLPEGQASIGVSAAKLQPDPYNLPNKALMIHLRKIWHCDTTFVSSKQTYILGDDQQVMTFVPSSSEPPFVLVLTTPRLGGGDEVPDALVQAVHLFKVLRFRKKMHGVNVLRIQRSALARFLEPQNWALTSLKSQPWAEFTLASSLPQDAKIRPVLALRGVQQLLKVGSIPPVLVPSLED